MKGQAASPVGAGVYGTNTSTSGTAVGVWGTSPSTAGIGVSGQATSTSGSTVGVYGWSGSSTGTGVLGGGAVGVYGSSSQLFVSASQPAAGVVGYNNSPAASGTPVWIFGYAPGSSSDTHRSYGVYGEADGFWGTGVNAQALGTNGVGVLSNGGIYGIWASTSNSAGVSGVFQNAGGGETLAGMNSSGTQVFSVDSSGGVVIDKNSANSGGLSPGITFGNASGEGIGSQRSGTLATGQYSLDFYTAAVRQLTIFNDGTVGLHILAPSTGNTLCYNTGAYSGVNSISTCSSLRKYKTEIKPLGTSLAEVMRLEPVEYVSTTSGRKEVGFIAEDMEKLDRRNSTYGSDGKLVGVQYDHMVALLTKAVQEQQAEIKQQHSQLEQLAQANAEKDQQIKMLSQQVRQLQQFQQALASVESRLAELEQTSGSSSARSLAGHRAVALNEE